MKKLTAILILITPIAYAQDFSQKDQKQIQNMMQQMQRAQSCMEKIDMSQMQQIESEQMQFEKDVKALCARNKRDQAQKKALSFTEEMANNPMIKAMNACNKMMAGTMADMSAMDQQDDYSDKHVCDSLMDFR